MKKMRTFSDALFALNNGRGYYRKNSGDSVKNRIWYLHKTAIAQILPNDEVQVNYNIGTFTRREILKRMEAIQMYFAVPLPLIEDGWVTIRAGADYKTDDIVKYARHLFYSQTGANVEEKVFKEIYLALEYGMGKEHWLMENPKQGLIWDICEKIKGAN